jgi:hypothetical protein
LGNLTIDGGGVTGTAGPLIAVSGGGTLSIINEPGSKTTGVTLKNNESGRPVSEVDEEKAGVLIRDGGYFNMESGVISGSDMGVTVYDGVFEMNGGRIEENVCGVLVNNVGKFKMSSGEIKNNPICGVDNFGVFNMNGGIIEGNGKEADENINKSGVLALGEFTMGGSACVKEDNFVYITGLRPIRVEPNNFHGLTKVIIITTFLPNIPLDGLLVLEGTGGELTDEDVEKFELLSPDMGIDFKDGNGVLAEFKAELSIAGGAMKKYTSLQKAVSAAQSGVENKIKLLKSVEIDSTIETIKIEKNITLAGEGNSITRNDFTEALFDVLSGGKLTLGGGGASLVIDGNGDNYDATETLINVSGGEVIMNNGVTLKNNKGSGVSMTGGTFTMKGGEISGNTTADGGGVYMANGTFMMTGGEISGNTATSDDGGGGVFMKGGEFTMTGGEISGNTATNGYGGGGGVSMTGESRFEMNDGEISGNTAADGGGVYMANGTFMMTGGEISGNTATYDDGGGGVFMKGGEFTMTGGVIICKTETNGYGGGGGVSMTGESRFEMNDGEISGNTADFGGGVYMEGESRFEMTGGEISGNTATSDGAGGGVYTNGNSTFEMKDGKISSNQANGNSGGVYTYGNSRFEMKGGEISGNQANGNGGGVYMKGNSVFTLSTGEISKNTANGNGGGVFMCRIDTSVKSVFTLSNGEISKNTAANGGGVYMEDGAFAMTDGKISDNTATSNTGGGGGVYMTGNSEFKFTGGDISYNEASNGKGVYNNTGNSVNWDITDNISNN